MCWLPWVTGCSSLQWAGVFCSLQTLKWISVLIWLGCIVALLSARHDSHMDASSETQSYRFINFWQATCTYAHIVLKPIFQLILQYMPFVWFHLYLLIQHGTCTCIYMQIVFSGTILIFVYVHVGIITTVQGSSLRPGTTHRSIFRNSKTQGKHSLVMYMYMYMYQGFIQGGLGGALAPLGSWLPPLENIHQPYTQYMYI